MLESVGSLLEPSTIRAVLGEAASRDFIRTLAIFTAAAWVHGTQVRKEIREQFSTLVDVLKQDLEGQKFLLGKLTDRVDKIEEQLHEKPEEA